MCLHTIDEETKHYTEGYKVFNYIGNKIYGNFYTQPKYRDEGYPTEEWIEDSNKIPIDSDFVKWYTKYGKNISYFKKYPSGYHFFINLEEAFSWKRMAINAGYGALKIFKIKVDKCVASGTQESERKDIKVGVAKRMKIIEKID